MSAHEEEGERYMEERVQESVNPIAALVEAARRMVIDPYDVQSQDELGAAIAAVEALKPMGWRCERGHVVDILRNGGCPAEMPGRKG